jgi:hypothetical protein
MLTLGGYYNREKSPGADWNGLPTRPDGSFYDFDRFVRSSPSWTYWNKANTNVFGEIKHELDNDWVIKVKGSYLDAKMDMLGASLYRLDPASDELQYNIGKYDYHHKQTAFDVNAQGKFDCSDVPMNFPLAETTDVISTMMAPVAGLQSFHINSIPSIGSSPLTFPCLSSTTCGSGSLKKLITVFMEQPSLT